MNEADIAGVWLVVCLVGLGVHYQWGGFLVGMTIGAGATFISCVVAPVVTSWVADRRARRARD